MGKKYITLADIAILNELRIKDKMRRQARFYFTYDFK